MTKHAHIMIIKTARELAGALWEEVMRDNAQYAIFKSMHPGYGPKALQQHFIAAATTRLLPQARATLAEMLATNIPEHLKEEIKDALVKDAALVRGRGTGLSHPVH